MKNIFCLIIMGLIQPLWSQSFASLDPKSQWRADGVKTKGTIDDANQSLNSIYLQALFNLYQAEKILGEPALLTDSATTFKEDVTVFSCAFTANAKDPKSGKTGIIYFLVKQFAKDSSAKNEYSFIKTANENHGIKVLHDLGDEAYFHTDGENFYFVMVRKGRITFNMKVNKITANTSLDQFNENARSITLKL